MAKNRGRIAAAIDIGSSAIRMLIAQARDGDMQQLEWLESPLNLGHETFTRGRIGFDTLARAADVLRGYYRLAREYRIQPELISTAATTAIREAANQASAVDQLRIQTGRDVTVLEDGQEKSVIFRETLRRVGGLPELEKSAYLMAYIGTGSVGVALCEAGRVTYSQNVRVGSLKLTGMMASLSERYEPLGAVLDEYLSALTRVMRDRLRPTPIAGFVVVAKDIGLIAGLCGMTGSGKEALRIPRGKLDELYRQIGNLAPAQLSAAYGLPDEQADILLPTLAIYRNLMDFTAAQEAVCPQVLLTQAMMYDLLYPRESKQLRKQFEQSVAASARRMAADYGDDRGHSLAVERAALDIFDCLRRVHGFTRRERLYLQTAAILHDIGKFVASADHHRITAHLVMDSSLIDLTRHEMAVVAHIARCHGDETPHPADPEFARLPAQDQLAVIKLSAILRLANALDRSHRQKFSDVSMRLQDGRLVIVGVTGKDALLEKWTFAQKSEFFGEVFGIQCELKTKGAV